MTDERKAARIALTSHPARWIEFATVPAPAPEPAPSCDHCGEPAVMRYLRQDLCHDCAPSEEQFFDHCAICERPIDFRESSVPLCNRCEGTAKAAGQYEADARRYPDPEGRR